MLSRVVAWLGLGKRKGVGAKRAGTPRARSATAHLFEKREAPPQHKSAARPAADNDFNPYNTGKFDRSASWERISKNQR